MLSINIQSDPATSARIASLRGEADFQTNPILERFLRELAEQRPSFVVLDLAAATFFGSLALGMLIQFRRSLMSHGGVVVLAGPNRDLAACLGFTRLDTVFPVYPTVGAALAHARQRAG